MLARAAGRLSTMNGRPCVKLGFVSMSMGLPLCPHDWIEEALGGVGQVAFEPSLEIKCKVEVTFNTRFSSFEQKRRIVKYSNILEILRSLGLCYVTLHESPGLTQGPKHYIK